MTRDYSWAHLWGRWRWWSWAVQAVALSMPPSFPLLLLNIRTTSCPPPVPPPHPPACPSGLWGQNQHIFSLKHTLLNRHEHQFHIPVLTSHPGNNCTSSCQIGSVEQSSQTVLTFSTCNKKPHILLQSVSEPEKKKEASYENIVMDKKIKVKCIVSG